MPIFRSETNFTTICLKAFGMFTRLPGFWPATYDTCRWVLDVWSMDAVGSFRQTWCVKGKTSQKGSAKHPANPTQPTKSTKKPRNHNETNKSQKEQPESPMPPTQHHVLDLKLSEETEKCRRMYKDYKDSQPTTNNNPPANYNWLWVVEHVKL